MSFSFENILYFIHVKVLKAKKTNWITTTAQHFHHCKKVYTLKLDKPNLKWALFKFWIQQIVWIEPKNTVYRIPRKINKIKHSVLTASFLLAAGETLQRFSYKLISFTCHFGSHIRKKIMKIMQCMVKWLLPQENML